MPTQLARKRIEAKPGIQLPFGLLSAAGVSPMEDVHEAAGVDWFSLGCGPADLVTWCDADDFFPDLPEFEETEKTFTSPTSRTAPPVTVYAAVECSAPGWSFDEGVTRAREIINTGEQAALERFFWALAVNGASDVPNLAGDGSVVGALGELENALAGVYGGVGVVHVPVVLASYMSNAGLTYRDGNRLRTLAGHLVSIGAGYPGTGVDGEEPDAGEVFMMITGPVFARQGPIADVPGEERQSINTRNNDRMVLAERTTVLQSECGAFVARAAKACCGSTTLTGS